MMIPRISQVTVSQKSGDSPAHTPPSTGAGDWMEGRSAAGSRRGNAYTASLVGECDVLGAISAGRDVVLTQLLPDLFG